MAFRIGRPDQWFYIEFSAPNEDDERIAEMESALAPRCPACGHSHDEQDRPELPELIAQGWRRVRRKPVRAAACGSTVGTGHVIVQCSCRAAFHGS